MSAPYAPPPETPDPVPPNRPRPASGRTLALWGVLVVVFVALYQLFASPSSSRHGSPRPPPVERELPLLPLAIPLVTLAGLGYALMALRAQLPAKYRTDELRQLVAPKAAPAATPAPVEPFEMTGMDQLRPVRLRVDEVGFHWHRGKRLLQSEQELEVSWEELEQFTVGHLYTGVFTVGLVLAIGGLMLGGTDLRLAGALVAVGGLVAFVGRRRRVGTLTVVTPSHLLSFSSRELTDERRARLLAAAKERRPQAVRVATVSGGRGLWLLFGQPFADLAVFVRSDASLRARLGARGSTFPDEETAVAATVQVRMWTVLSSGLRAILPVATGAAMALRSGDALSCFGPAVLTWVVGLVVVVRVQTRFARWAGMGVVR